MAVALIVHRRATVRRFAALGLRMAGFDAVAAEELASAGRQLEAQPIDLLLTEDELGLGSGQQLMAAAQRLHPRIAMVLLTARGRPPRGLEDVVLPEPFDIDQLTAAAERALAAAANRQPREQPPPETLHSRLQRSQFEYG